MKQDVKRQCNAYMQNTLVTAWGSEIMSKKVKMAMMDNSCNRTDALLLTFCDYTRELISIASGQIDLTDDEDITQGRTFGE